MTTIQPLPITFDILEKIPAQSSDVITLIYNDPTYASTRFGISEGYQTNAFLTELYVYCEIDSLAEVPLPAYNLEDSESERVLKTLNSVWGSDIPKFYLQLWRWKESASAWYPRGKISLTNNYGYPYTISRPFDLLTDNIARDMGEKHKLGVSIVDAGSGLLKTIDSVIIDGCWKQDVRIVRPDTPIISVSGGSVVSVTQYKNTSTSTVSATVRKNAIPANTGRISASITNTHASNIVYVAYRDITITSTNNDGAIPPNGSVNISSTYKGDVYILGSAANTSYTTIETYNQ